MYGSWMDGWIRDGPVDRSIDRSIDHSWMDGFIQSFVQTSAHTGRRGFHSVKTCDREDRTFITQLIFVYFLKILTFVGPGALTPGDRLVCPAFFFRNPINNKLWSFLKFGFLMVFVGFPLATGRETASCYLFWFFSFIPQAGKIQV